MKKQDKKILIRILLITFGLSGIVAVMNNSYASIGGIVGVLGIGTLFVIAVQIIIVLLGLVGHGLIAGLTGAVSGSGTAVSGIRSIFFNHNSLTTAAYFADGSFTLGLPSDAIWQNSGLLGNNPMYMISQKVTQYYYVMRNLSIAILLFILLYIAIRMAMSTLSKDEAKYKRMLTDWAVSLALVFVLHYIMIITFYISNTLVSILETTLVDDTTMDYTALILEALIPFAGFGEAIVFLMLIGMEITFLFMYIKRIVVLGFLILIAPLITVTYSLDKIGDTKSQALNTWLKEFIYNVIIQPFHCILYLTMINTVIHEMAGKEGIGGFIVYIVILQFVKEAEEIIKKIFNIQANSMPAIKGMGLMAVGAFKLFGSAGKAAGAAGAGKKMPDMTSAAGGAAGAAAGSAESAARSAATTAEKGAEKTAEDAAKNAAKNAAQQKNKSTMPDVHGSTMPDLDMSALRKNPEMDSIDIPANGLEPDRVTPPPEPIIATPAPGAGAGAGAGTGTGTGTGVADRIAAVNASKDNWLKRQAQDAKNAFVGTAKFFSGPDMDWSTKEGRKAFNEQFGKAALKYGTAIGSGIMAYGMGNLDSALVAGTAVYGLNEKIDSAVQEHQNAIQLEKNEDAYDDRYIEYVEEYSRLTGEMDEDKIRDNLFDAIDKYDEGQLSFDTIRAEEGEQVAKLKRDFLKNTYSELKKSYEVGGGEKGSELVKSHTVTDSSPKYQASH